jgi:hypothetical protein
LPVAATVAVILVESSITWLLVSTSPSALITMPVPAAASLLYCRAVLMITRPGLTLVSSSIWPVHTTNLGRERRSGLA